MRNKYSNGADGADGASGASGDGGGGGASITSGVLNQVGTKEICINSYHFE